MGNQPERLEISSLTLLKEKELKLKSPYKEGGNNSEA